MATAFLFSNNAIATLASSVAPSDTTINLTTGGGALFPSPAANQQFALTLYDAATGVNNEIVYVTGRTVDELTVVRGQEGTAAQNWAAGDFASNFCTAGQMRALLQTALAPFQPGYWSDTGAANALAIAPSPAVEAYSAGLGFLVVVNHDNTGAATLNVNGLGAKALADGSGNALVAGMIVAGQVTYVVYDGTKFRLLATLPPAQFISSLPDRGGLLDTDRVAVNAAAGGDYKVAISDLSAAVSKEQFQQAFFLGMMGTQA